ncbi:MAG: glycosyltransferase [Bacteroidia bacterium]|nr:glycosyltransferase [Bacteroidia bacterium]
MKPITFSLITVCYNAEKLLPATLQTAVNQTFKNFELVIIDGGSKDNSLQVLEPFKPYIGTLISEPDKGIYDAMNKGVKAAKGEYVYFLNAGDSFYDNQVLERIYEAIQKSHSDFFYAKVETKNEPTGVNYITGKPVEFAMFYSHYPICHQATFAKKAVFEKIGYFNINYSLVADGEWFIRLFKEPSLSKTYLDQMVAFYDIQGATYFKRMKGYKEYIRAGFTHFPLHRAIFNWLLYPVIYTKVWFIRNFQNTAWFKKYRALKFRNTLAKAS